MKRNANPRMAFPQPLTFEERAKRSGKPIAMMMRVYGAMLTLNPNVSTIHAVSVVPMLAPSSTLAACCRVRMPALTNETAMTVVTEDDWMSKIGRASWRERVERSAVGGEVE